MISPLLRSNQTPDAQPNAASNRFVLWVDGVGAFLLFLDECVTIGGPGESGERAGLPLLANLSGRHASIIRSGEGYVLEGHGPARVNGRAVEQRTDLSHNYEIALGESVRLRFRQPSPLSRTAALEFLTDHRPARSVDGVLLMDDTCLLGPGPENHIRCPHWETQLLLFRRDGELRCKAAGPLMINGQQVESGSSFGAGDIVSGPDGRFRLEQLEYA